MKTASTLVLLSLAIATLSHPISVTPAVAEGDPCTPYIPVDCGAEVLLNKSVTPAGETFGPNVCEVEYMFMAPTFSYQYKQVCYGFKHYFCYLVCANTKDCNDTRHYTKTQVGCCEGFTTAQTATDSEYFSKHYGSQGTPTKATLKKEGCPRETQSTVQDCLVELNLTSLGNAFLNSTLGAVLASAESMVTVFAPSGGLDQSSIGSEQLEAVLGTHIVDEIIPAAFLLDGQRLDTLSDGLFLHITEVDSKRMIEDIFVNGMELTGRDACVADNGIVHVIDGFILAEKRTVAEVVADTEELSILNSLITAAGVEELGLNGSKLLTLFAPTNEAFEGLESMGFIDCLLMEENEKSLQEFLQYHISTPAEYSSSLALRDSVSTKYCYKIKTNHFHRYQYYYKCSKLQIQLENDTILVGNDGAQVTQADIAASNGVVHFISEPLSATNLDLEELCSATPSPTPSTDIRSSPLPEDPSQSTNTPTDTTQPTAATEPVVEGGERDSEDGAIA